MLALLFAAQIAAADAPPPPPPSAVPLAPASAPPVASPSLSAKPAADVHLKVLVLDVNSTDMTASEKTTLTNLEAAHLSEDARLEVLSGEDLRQLVKLQGQAADLGVSGNCTDACMAELAGALGAGVVIATQAGKLGETLVVTLAVFDAARAKSVSRKSIEATSIGEVPAKLGPALDALMQPLVAARTSTSPSAATTSSAPNAPMSARVAELYGAEAIQICTSPKDTTVWWFCTSKTALTENAFVREYQSVIGARDLDHAEFNRSAIPIAVPIGLFILAGGGVVVMAGTAVCAQTAACGDDVESALGKNGGAPMALPLGLGAAAIVGGLTGGILTFPTEDAVEGKPEMHTLTEGEGRAAIARYNDALRAKLEHDLGGS